MLEEIYITKQHLSSPSKFKSIDELRNLVIDLKNRLNIGFSEEDLIFLVLSACRCNEFGIVVEVEKNKFLMDVKALKNWITEKLIPGTVLLNLDDPDILRLLIFSIEITYSMFSGESRATVTQKGFRERKRSFEGIVVDQFVGKLGEVAVKKFLERHFEVEIELDWEISSDITSHRNDIKNSKKLISVKTSPNLAGIWAEADKGYDYGIMVKCAVPEHPLLQFFIETCGFKTLLNFVESISKDELIREYLNNIRTRVFDFSDCGQVRTQIACFVCGYFQISEDNLKNRGEKLEYLGEVREQRHFVKVCDLKYTLKDWKKFLEDIGFEKVQSKIEPPASR